MEKKMNKKMKSLSYLLLILCFHLIYFKVKGSVNLALYKPANQSSTIKPAWSADKAVDGNKNGNVASDSCGHTDRGHTEAWWQVDLEINSTINNILIYYRDWYGNRLLGYYLYVSNSSDWRTGNLCYNHQGPVIPSSFQNISCTTTGRYVTVYNFRNRTHVSWGHEDQAILELCEVEVYGCPVGNYGTNCSSDCPSNCKQGICDPDTGECLLGCTGRYTGQICDIECTTGTFGSNCSEKCGYCKDGKPCDHVTGYCNGGCEQGWSYPLCDKCESGWYGLDCNRTCGHCYGNVSCDGVTGICEKGCDCGYTGQLCIERIDTGTNITDYEYGYMIPLLGVSSVAGVLLISLIITCTVCLRLVFTRRNNARRSKDNPAYQRHSVDNVYTEVEEVDKVKDRDTKSLNTINKHLSVSTARHFVDVYESEFSDISNNQLDEINGEEMSSITAISEQRLSNSAQWTEKSLMNSLNASDEEEYLEMNGKVVSDDEMYLAATETSYVNYSQG